MISYKISKGSKMAIHAKTKAIALFCVLMIQQNTSYGITEVGAGTGTLVAALLTTAVAAKCTDNPAFAGGIFVVTAAATYGYLRQYTPKSKLAEIKSDLNVIEQNPHAVLFVPKEREKEESLYLELSDETFKQQYTSGKLQQKFEADVKIEARGLGLYAVNKAYDNMCTLNEPMKIINEQINAVREDAYNDGDEAKQLWEETNNRYLNYDISMKLVDYLIRELPCFKADAIAYNAQKLQDKAAERCQQNADTYSRTQDKFSEAAFITAQSQQEQSKAVRSWVLLEWLRTWFPSLFGSKK